MQFSFIRLRLTLGAETTAAWPLKGSAKITFNTNDCCTCNMTHITESVAE